ncbi:MAG: hypothetical protein RLZZ126_2110 [Pseudomonadota bacterium]|jgi:1,4-dihydroxy-2-naphthoyl-CoA hydrolase
MTRLAQAQQLIDGIFPGLMGVKLTVVEPDRVCADLWVKPEICTAGGILHGGAFMAFADTLGAVGTVVNLPPGTTTTTTDSSTKFMRGAKVGALISAESLPLHKGRSTQVWQTTIRNAEGKLCAVVTQTQMILNI